MKVRSRRFYEARASIARALAHASRLRLLDALSARERTVGELSRIVGLDQSTVSKHLSQLRGVGLVDSRRDGTQRVYRVTCACLESLFSCIEDVVVQRIESEKAILE